MRTPTPFPLMTLSFYFSIFFLQFGCIVQDDGKKLGGGPGAENFPFKPFFDQFRNQTAMVKMGMSQKQIINSAWRNREWLPVTVEKFSFLIKTTINQKV